MNYELAKELKDAGFPQNLGGGQMISVSGGLAPFTGEFYVPTLSELIEACGLRFKRLVKQSRTKWKAQATGLTLEEKTRTPDLHIFGSTPKEAVARLWLAINKK